MGQSNSVERDQYYILRDGEIVPVGLSEWAEWFEDSKQRVVGQEEIDGVLVSTVFIGIDHRFSGDGPPILFEAMVFGKDREELAGWRGCTLEEAQRVHQRLVDAVANGEDLNKLNFYEEEANEGN